MKDYVPKYKYALPSFKIGGFYKIIDNETGKVARKCKTLSGCATWLENRQEVLKDGEIN